MWAQRYGEIMVEPKTDETMQANLDQTPMVERPQPFDYWNVLPTLKNSAASSLDGTLADSVA